MAGWPRGFAWLCLSRAPWAEALRFGTNLLSSGIVPGDSQHQYSIKDNTSCTAELTHPSHTYT